MTMRQFPQEQTTTSQDDLARFLAGDPDAYGRLAEAMRPSLYSLARSYLPDHDDAADAAQLTLVKGWQGRRHFGAGDCNLRAWLYRILVNTCLDVVRRDQRLRWVAWEAPKHDHLLLMSSADDPAGSTLTQETRTIVQCVLDKMSHRHRLALILREYEGMGCAEIGEVMGLGRSAVKSMLFRARAEFRRVYGTQEAAERRASRQRADARRSA